MNQYIFKMIIYIIVNRKHDEMGGKLISSVLFPNAQTNRDLQPIKQYSLSVTYYKSISMHPFKRLT